MKLPGKRRPVDCITVKKPFHCSLMGITFIVTCHLVLEVVFTLDSAEVDVST